MKQNQNQQLRLLTYTGVLTALTTVATMHIRIPTITKGYINLGDTIVNIAAWMLGPFYGAAAAGIGSALADLLAGYTVYVPATLIIKALMAVVCYYLYQTLSRKQHSVWARILSAIASASDTFEEGAVGAGRGTTCYGMKGGIGSSSRVMRIDETDYTIGILVQSNYGSAKDFRDATLPDDLAPCDKGSIILVCATDLPLSARQLRRVLRRASVGMARLGSYIGHGSGEIAVGFTTAPRTEEGSFYHLRVLREDRMDIPFRAIGECAEEAILKSMLNAEPDVTLSGKKVPSLGEYLARRPGEEA